MAETIYEHTMSYTVGTIVWVKTSVNIWWPAIVVDAGVMPEQSFELERESKSASASLPIHFKSENTHYWIKNMKRVCLYTCPKKMEYIEKGYSTYLKQKNDPSFLHGKFNMEHFISDVKNFEMAIGGDENIFDVVDRNIKHQKNANNQRIALVKKLFTKSKKYKKKSLTDKRCTKTPNLLNQTKPNQLNQTQNSQTDPPETTKNKNCNPPQESKGRYVCFKSMCNFSSNRFYLLKHHMQVCQYVKPTLNNQKLDIEKKQKQVRKGRKANKKKKSIVEQIAEDWSDNSD